MVSLMQVRSFLLALVLAFTSSQSSLAQSDLAGDSFDQILARAEGQTVYWNAWGGSALYNGYIEWVADQVEQRFGVKLRHVKITDTVLAVRKVQSEQLAGKLHDGSIDLIWINGENFKIMKEEGLLFGPFTNMLPNMRFVDPAKTPSAFRDFTIATDGMEAPWGLARFIILYDQALTRTPPTDPETLLAWARAHPGRVSYPAPPDFTGTSFLKQALLQLHGPDPRFGHAPDPQSFNEMTEPLWQWLDELHLFSWRKGKQFPRTGSDLIRLLEEGAVDFAYSYNIGEAAALIANQRLPASARTAVFDKGSLSNAHFVAIPFNSSAREGAMVVANFLLSPEAQARKSDLRYWGEATVLSLDGLDEADKRFFDEIQTSPAILQGEALGAGIDEPHPAWGEALEREWMERYQGR